MKAGKATRQTGPSLPASARLPLNRCNLPAVILGGLRFQEEPSPIRIDGVAAFHRELFDMLDSLDLPADRAQRFTDYMAVHFRLKNLEDAGLGPRCRKGRAKADYLRVLRGWSFDPDGREAAVLKHWVESRFGLLPRYHKGPLRDFTGDAHDQYQSAMAMGLYNTNALEEQLDLLFSFCQYELDRRFPACDRITLYRGVNRVDDCEIIEWRDERNAVILFNNINSFTSQRERACEFGDYILTVDVPMAKVFAFTDLLPERLRGESEFVVVGGVYVAAVSTM